MQIISFQACSQLFSVTFTIPVRVADVYSGHAKPAHVSNDISIQRVHRQEVDVPHVNVFTRWKYGIDPELGKTCGPVPVNLSRRIRRATVKQKRRGQCENETLMDMWTRMLFFHSLMINCCWLLVLFL